MKAKIIFEIARLKANKVLLSVICTLFAFSILLIIGGILSHKDYQEKKEAFLEYERLKVAQLRSYEQYGALGFNIIKDISPLSIFFDSGVTMAVQKTKIDTSEILEVGNTREGKCRYQNEANPISFSTFFILVTGLISVLIGVNNFSGKMFLRLYSKEKFIIISIFGRFLFFELIYLTLIAILFVLIILSNIYFNIDEIWVLIKYLWFFLILSGYGKIREKWSYKMSGLESLFTKA